MSVLCGCALLWPFTDCRCLSAAEVPDKTAPCRQRLEAIYGAIQQYRHLYRRLPDELSDLVFEQLLPATMLVCPSSAGLQDDSAESSLGSYRYEFEHRPLTNDLAKALGLTLRDWRQWQMGRTGSDVPLVRCPHHVPMLNLAFGGGIYESGSAWEERFTSLVNPEELTLEVLLREHVHLEVTRIDSRDPGTPAGQLDLTAYYNRVLKGSPEWEAENAAIDLPRPAILGGVTFDARGVVQLGSRNYTMTHRPAAVSNIVVGLACRSLVFLHGTIKNASATTPIEIAQYQVHFKDGTAEAVPIRYGRHVLDWRTNPASVSWVNFNLGGTVLHELSGPSGTNWLYSMRWINPHPDILIDHLDFKSLMTQSCPFLVAVSAEEVKPVAPPSGGPANEEQPYKAEIEK